MSSANLGDYVQVSEVRETPAETSPSPWGTFPQALKYRGSGRLPHLEGAITCNLLLRSASEAVFINTGPHEALRCVRDEPQGPKLQGRTRWFKKVAGSEGPNDTSETPAFLSLEHKYFQL